MEDGSRKYDSQGQEWNHFHRAKSNGACISAVPCLLNGTEVSWEESRDKLCLIYGIMPQEIPVVYDGYGKKLLVDYTLSYLWGDLVLERHDYAAKQ